MAADGVAQRFRPSLPLTLTWAAATVVLLALGIWQLHRLAAKTVLLERAERALHEPARELPAGSLEAGALDFARLRVRGTYLPETSVALGLSTRDGRAGARLLTALRLEDGRTLLVDRGFVPEMDLARSIGAPAPEGLREIEGVARGGSPGTWATPGPDLTIPRWYAPDLEAIGRHLGLRLEPVLLVLERPEPDVDGFPVPVPGPVTVDVPNPHLGYALTWFGLAGALLVVYIRLGRRPLGERGS